MHAYKVGQLYHPDRTSWPEGAEYDYRASSHELHLFYANLKPQEIMAITRRPSEFGALAIPPVLFFLYKFQSDSDWSDCPYNWHLVKAARPDEATEPPELEERERVLLNVVLVAATTGIIAGLRAVSLSINLSRYLHQAIRDQIAQPVDQRQYDEALMDIYRRMPTAELVRRAERMLVR